ncbi:glycosyltransferase family 1 protein [Pseudonocardia sp. EV170527-09]|nr:glycosyltransferase family 1 protein [Pseudonocardia sp. EV170527-09]
MRVLVLAPGSTGDVAPYTGLGQRLRDGGHHVAIAANERFRSMVTGAGLEFRLLRGDPEPGNTSEGGRRWHAAAPARSARRGWCAFCRTTSTRSARTSSRRSGPAPTSCCSTPSRCSPATTSARASASPPPAPSSLLSTRPETYRRPRSACRAWDAPSTGLWTGSHSPQARSRSAGPPADCALGSAFPTCGPPRCGPGCRLRDGRRSTASAAPSCRGSATGRRLHR